MQIKLYACSRQLTQAQCDLTACRIPTKFKPDAERSAMLRLTILLIALALTATAAQAQAVFRSVMPDGRIIYGDKPAPGAKESKQVNLPPPNISAPTPPGSGGPTSQQQAADAADASVRAAQQQLQAAKAALETGREPREGERIGTAGGASRLTDAYFQRIKTLEAAIAAAQKQLDDAFARRNATR